MNKIEAEAWKHGTDLQQPDKSRKGNKGGKKGKGLVKNMYE